jgi:hypothetical protein
VFNGDIECEFRKYELFEGKKALNWAPFLLLMCKANDQRCSIGT